MKRETKTSLKAKIVFKAKSLEQFRRNLSVFFLHFIPCFEGNFFSSIYKQSCGTEKEQKKVCNKAMNVCVLEKDREYI